MLFEPFLLQKENLHCLVIKHPDVVSLVDVAILYLQKHGCVVDCVDTMHIHTLPKYDYSFALLFGGDGLALRMGRFLGAYNIPILVINTGTVGFMTACEKHDWQKTLDDLLAGLLIQHKHSLLNCNITNKAEHFLALNEVCLMAEKRGKICHFMLSIDGDTSLGLIRADGLIIATPTGSTAYALACGGPIVAPGVKAMLVLAINPYAMAYRPIVVSAQQTITIRIAPHNRHAVVMMHDGEHLGYIENDQKLTVSMASDCVHFIYPQNHSFYATLTKKLGWNAGIFSPKVQEKLC